MDEKPVLDANPSSWRIPAIDGVRALAMLMVYSFHSWEFSGSPTLIFGAFGHQV